MISPRFRRDSDKEVVAGGGFLTREMSLSESWAGLPALSLYIDTDRCIKARVSAFFNFRVRKNLLYINNNSTNENYNSVSFISIFPSTFKKRGR